MEIHFSQNLKLKDSKKGIISDLVCQRIVLLIGARKASYIGNIFFCDTFPEGVISLQDPWLDLSFSRHICLSTNCRKVDLYLSSHILNSLICQMSEGPHFDDAIMAISRKLPVSSFS